LPAIRQHARLQAARPDPNSIATWLAIVLDDPDVLTNVPGDERGFSVACRGRGGSAAGRGKAGPAGIRAVRVYRASDPSDEERARHTARPLPCQHDHAFYQNS